jgi:NADP-dependent 3-hydroxy acid dehydrogenase YdfG
MSKTILITGASSGIGKETAKLFSSKGWQVVATMRAPQKETELIGRKDIIVTGLDVTQSQSIAGAIASGLKGFGKIDVLLNNAGYGAYGPLEAFPMDRIRRQFDTNVIGLRETTKAVLPHFRKQGHGTIVNMSSIGGQMTFPLGALYHGTHFAVEGISASLRFVLGAAAIKLKTVKPGMIITDCCGRSFDFVNDETMSEYQPVVQALFARWSGEGAANCASSPKRCCRGDPHRSHGRNRYLAIPRGRPCNPAAEQP